LTIADYKALSISEPWLRSNVTVIHPDELIEDLHLRQNAEYFVDDFDLQEVA
jgi:hypothetical protein